jgi:hypothetical protein
MRLAQDNDVVHTFTPDRSDQPFGKAVLPRRGWCDRLVPEPRFDPKRVLPAHQAGSALAAPYRFVAALPVAFIDDPQYTALLSPRLRGEDIWSCEAYDEAGHYLKLVYPEGESDFIVAGSITDLPVEAKTVDMGASGIFVCTTGGRTMPRNGDQLVGDVLCPVLQPVAAGVPPTQSRND